MSWSRVDASFWTTIVDLALPARCAGCGESGRAWCPRCAAELAAAAPRLVVPDPAPPGLPPVVAVGAYGGSLSSAIIAYKDRGRHGLADVLGDRLAAAAAAATTTATGAPLGRDPGRRGLPVLLVPVPATAAAARRRHGDHMSRLARRAAATLRAQGVPAAVACPLRAGRRPDSAGLTVEQRQVAAGAFAIRPGRLPPLRSAVTVGARVIVVDDVVTTGATIAAVATRLREVGIRVGGAAVLAATPRRCR